MNDREKTIQFEMQYCQHYKNGKGGDMICTAGIDLKTFQRVATGPAQIKWGPCIQGHLLPNPTMICPHWIRRTREQGGKKADSMERSMAIFTRVNPFINDWRKKKPTGKIEIVECPVCEGKLHLGQSSYNGHVHAKCETANCVNFME